MPISIESPESSSPIVTRAVAAGLRDKYCDTYEFPSWQKILLTGMSVLPQSVARFVISRFESITGLSPNVMEHFSMDELLNIRLQDYEALNGPFPVILVGAALSGAVT